MSVPLRLITHEDPQSPVSEAYRMLRTNIQFAALDKPVKRITITSSTPGEGKTTALANLAVTMAQAGNKVILIDADLRRPTMGRLFGLDEYRGLTTVLMGRAALEEVIFPTVIENLRILPSGPIPPNPSELIGSVAMERLLEELDKHADYILIDCPTIMAVADASILAPKTDGVILLAQIGEVPRDMIRKAKIALETTKTRILGVMANRVKMGKRDNYYYNYYLDNKEDGQNDDSMGRGF